jgi:photosystem II PsbU protein
VVAFTPLQPQQQLKQQSSTALNASPIHDRRQFVSAATGMIMAGLTLARPANANRDYADVGLLGGSDIIDINNANVRAYIRLPGMYPSAAGKIASNGPYGSVSEIFNIKGLSNAEKDVMKKYESRFVAKKPSADFVIDRINNGLYR